MTQEWCTQDEQGHPGTCDETPASHLVHSWLHSSLHKHHHQVSGWNNWTATATINSTKRHQCWILGRCGIKWSLTIKRVKDFFKKRDTCQFTFKIRLLVQKQNEEPHRTRFFSGSCHLQEKSWGTVGGCREHWIKLKAVVLVKPC